MRDDIHKRLLQELEAGDWQYAPHDPVALRVLKDRIADTGKQFGLISYSDLVKGVDFHYPKINDGKAYRITFYDHDLVGLNRRIIGDCLGYISLESYKKAGFMASALVVGRIDSKPSDIFFDWMESLQVLSNTNEDTVLKFWVEQVQYAHQYYKYGKKSPHFTGSD